MPDENTPLVSICIPTFNRAAMIGTAIESALGQTYQNIEVIVVDNASTDDTDAAVMAYTDVRLKYVKNERNLGLFGNFNRCIELANGMYLHILHSDDYLDPDFTATCIAFFLKNPTVVMTSTGACVLRDGGISKYVSWNTDMVFPAPEGFRILLRERSFINCPSVMVLREVYQKAGPFSLECPYSSDFYQWLRISRTYDIGFVSGTNVWYREGEHSESFRFLFTSPQGYLDTIRLFIQLRLDLGDDYDCYADEFLAAQQRFIRDCFFAGFTRSDRIKEFSPLVFMGMSYSCWTLEKPVTAYQWLGKTKDLFIILFTGLLISCSPIRNLIKLVLFSGRSEY